MTFVHAQASWTVTKAQLPIYLNGTTATMSFGAPSNLPTGRTLSVVAVDYTWTPYTNIAGATEEVMLCYNTQYSYGTPTNCRNISAVRSGGDAGFRLQNAKGTFYIRHRVTLPGTSTAAFPINPTGRDSVTVTYN